MTVTWPLNQDPAAEREQQTYAHPVPSREYILVALQQAGKPLTHKELYAGFGLEAPEAIEALRRRLMAMCRDAQLLRTRRKAFGLIEHMHLIRGRVQAHKDGYGFVLPMDSQGRIAPKQERQDYYVSPHEMQRLFDGDEVLIQDKNPHYNSRGRQEARVVEIVARHTQQLVGHYYHKETFGEVVPDHPRLRHTVLIPAGASLNAQDGQVVEVKLHRQPDFHQAPMGEVIQVLGHAMDPGLEIQMALRTYDIPHTFAPEVLAQAASFAQNVPDQLTDGRIDLRDLPLVTIDGEDAKDFDDAVYCQRQPSGSWKLYVAIADVSHYVAIDSPLDKEAYQRGTSVYFPGQVVPMLPEALSNGLCSLNPQQNRYALVCEMNISARGNLSRYRFYRALIRSHARLTYTQVGALLTEPDSASAQDFRQTYPKLIKPLQALHALYQILRAGREARGAIDFETQETRIVFGEARKIERIIPVERNDAHKLIEECMLCANVAAARFLIKHKIPGLYRVHAGPKAQKLEGLKGFLAELGLTLGGGEQPSPQDYQALMARISERPDREIIQSMVLRSLSQAVYSPENEGHFGLAYPAYAHFTSPIRRYPDLLVHRALGSLLDSQQASAHVLRGENQPIKAAHLSYPYDFETLLVLGEHVSMTERRADEATRDVEDWLKCEYLSAYIGETFPGTVTTVTGFGLFVRLDDIYVEGLIHISNLPADYYEFKADKQRLVGEHTRRSFRLGDHLQVRVASVNLEERKIDFDLVQNALSTRTRRPAKAPTGHHKTSTTSKGREQKKKPKPSAPPAKAPTQAASAEEIQYPLLIDILAAADTPPAKKKKKKRLGKNERARLKAEKAAEATKAQEAHQPKASKKKKPKKKKAEAKKSCKKKTKKAP